MSFDGKAFGVEIVSAVKAHLATMLAPVLRRLDDLESGQTEITARVDRAAPPPTREQIAEAIGSTSGVLEDAVRRHLEERPPAAGRDGRDGVGLAGALIDRAGNLVLTLSDGTAREIGPVAGKDGERGEDGRDGFSLSAFDAALMDDGRTVVLSFEQGDQSLKVELSIPAMIYRGVFGDGRSYERGDTVTWGGSLWHCDAPTSEKPGEGSTAWTLAAKRGRDGKDGVVKAEKASKPVRVGAAAKGA